MVPCRETKEYDVLFEKIFSSHVSRFEFEKSPAGNWFEASDALEVNSNEKTQRIIRAIAISHQNANNHPCTLAILPALGVELESFCPVSKQSAAATALCFP